MNRTNDEPAPLSHLRALEQRYPGAAKRLRSMRLEKGRGLPDWPGWCFVPLAGAAAVVAAGPLDLRRALDISRVGALGAWSVTKGVYRFDPDLFRELWDSPFEGEVPLSLLTRLPEWCVYVELPAAADSPLGPLRGFYAHLEHDAHDGDRELRLLLDLEANPLPGQADPRAPEGWETLFPLVLHLDRTVGEALAETARQGLPGEPPSAPRGLKALAGSLLSLLFFLVASPADVEGPAGARPHNPRPVKTRHGPKLFPADRPTRWEVGWRLGAALRRARERPAPAGAGQPHASPRPHVRRAHWHGYWVGPRANPTLELCWLPPVLVNAAGEGDDLPAVVWRAGEA